MEDSSDEDANASHHTMKQAIKRHKRIIKSLASPKKQANVKWAFVIVFVALCASFGLSFISNKALADVSLVSALIIVFAFIVIGIMFDIVGTAVTAANATPFHSMASRKVKGAKTALGIIRSASRVSNFCNDVIGDITGIVSGGAVVVVVGYFAITFEWAKNTVLLNLVLTSIVAALTIGGKAIGKNIALNYSNTIIYYVALVIESIAGLFKKKPAKQRTAYMKKIGGKGI